MDIKGKNTRYKFVSVIWSFLFSKSATLYSITHGNKITQNNNALILPFIDLQSSKNYCKESDTIQCIKRRMTAPIELCVWWIMGQHSIPNWSVSQRNSGAPWGLFRMSMECNASSTTKQWLEGSVWQSTKRDTQGTSPQSHSIF